MKLLLFLFTILTCANTNAQQTTDDRWVTYRDEANGYQFTYPRFWQVKKFMEEVTISQPVADSDEISFFVSPNGKDTGQKSLDKLVVKLMNNIKDRQDFQLIRSGEKKLGAYAGFTVEFTNTTGKERKRMHSISWQISKGAHMYRIMYRGYKAPEATATKTMTDIFESFSFLDNPNLLNNAVLQGRWEGTIAENVPGTTTPKPYPFTLLIKAYDEPENRLEITQLVENFLLNKKDTSKKRVHAILTGEHLSLMYNKTALDKSTCAVTLKLQHTIKDGQHYLEGISSNDPTRCYVGLELKKISDATELPYSKPVLIVQETVPPAPLPKPAATPPAQPMPTPTEAASFVVNAKDITRSSDKAFRWYKWEAAPAYLREATRYINTYNKETLYDEIAIRLKDSCPIKIAATDLNEDGIFGICMQAEESRCCGTRGCDFSLYENGGLLTVDLGTEFEAKPTRNGVISSAGLLFPLKQNTLGTVGNAQAITKRFAFKQAGNTQVQRPVAAVKPVGGTTPEELGKTLLRAIKTNDKGLWLACFLPPTAWKAVAFQPEDGRESRYDHILNMYVRQMNHLRQELQEHGFSNYENIRFSRVVFSSKNNNGQTDYVLVNESYVSNFSIEVTYGTEFVGSIGSMNLGRDVNGRYFVASQGGFLKSARRR